MEGVRVQNRHREEHQRVLWDKEGTEVFSVPVRRVDLGQDDLGRGCGNGGEETANGDTSVAVS